MSIYVKHKSLPQLSCKSSFVSSKEMEGGEQQNLNDGDPPEQAEDDAGVSTGSGRFYECVFCKRGFSTAQALGGHMNIHRRDRTKIRPARLSPPATRRGEEAYHPYSREQRRVHPQAVESTSSNYVVYFPGSSSSAAGGGDKSELALAGEELQLGFGGPGDGGGAPGEEGKDKGIETGAEDLDLELRLGRSKINESSDC